MLCIYGCLNWRDESQVCENFRLFTRSPEYEQTLIYGDEQSLNVVLLTIHDKDIIPQLEYMKCYAHVYMIPPGGGQWCKKLNSLKNDIHVIIYLTCECISLGLTSIMDLIFCLMYISWLNNCMQAFHACIYIRAIYSRIIWPGQHQCGILYICMHALC